MAKDGKTPGKGKASLVKDTTGKGGKKRAIKNHPKPEYSTEWIKVEFTEDELKEKSNDLAATLQSIDQLDSELASIKKKYGSLKDAASLKARELAADIRNKFDHRNEKCLMVKDFKKKTVTFFVCSEPGSDVWDKEVKSRGMHPDEMQMTLDDVDQSPDPDGPVAG